MGYAGDNSERCAPGVSVVYNTMTGVHCRRQRTGGKHEVGGRGIRKTSNKCS